MGTQGCRRNASTAKERQGQGISCWECVGPGGAGGLPGGRCNLILDGQHERDVAVQAKPKAKARKRSAKAANKLCWDGNALA